MDKTSLFRELQKRHGVSVPFALKEYLFREQLAFVQDPAPFKIAVTTRRAGKSTSCVADLTFTAVDNPNSVCLYITLSRKNAKRLVWPEFKRLNKKFHLRGIPNESDLSITYLNGSVIYLLGAKDRSSIEDMRGLPVKKAYLDETQSFPAYIKDLIDDVIGPSLMDHAGTLCVIGTPGPVPVGYFYDLTKNPEWSHHFWSWKENPYIPPGMLDRELKRRGVTVKDPSIQREWFGKWVIDRTSLVFQYDSAINDYTELPKAEWTFILGIDLGFDDADALAVLAYQEFGDTTYLVEEMITPHQDITSLRKQIDKLQKKYDFSRIVIDTAGLGKKITEEISKRYKIPMIPADKSRKLEYIELFNDTLRNGKFKAKPFSKLSQDCNKVEWDRDKSTPDKKIISDRFHSDICDAVVYAWKEAYAYAFEKKPDSPKPGTSEYFKQQEDEMFDGEFERISKIENGEDD